MWSLRFGGRAAGGRRAALATLLLLLALSAGRWPAGFADGSPTENPRRSLQQARRRAVPRPHPFFRQHAKAQQAAARQAAKAQREQAAAERAAASAAAAAEQALGKFVRLAVRYLGREAAAVAAKRPEDRAQAKKDREQAKKDRAQAKRLRGEGRNATLNETGNATEETEVRVRDSEQVVVALHDLLVPPDTGDFLFATDAGAGRR